MGKSLALSILKSEKLFFILFLLMIILTFFMPYNFLKAFKSVDWNTIEALAGLLIITASIKESFFFDKISSKILGHVHTERTLAMSVVLLSMTLSMFLTNDITLFIVVPITLSLKKFFKNDVSKLIVFEALSVNVGSTVSPIGNPQNLFLWHLWNTDFTNFIVASLPLEIVMVSLLLLFALFIFKRKPLLLEYDAKSFKVNYKLGMGSIIILILYVMIIQLHLEAFFIVPLFAFYFLVRKDVLKEVDWFLLAIFVLMFVNIYFITKIPLFALLIKPFSPFTPSKTFLLSLISSQAISNVPAAIFVSNFSSSYLAIAYGVNIGGNGLIIGSLANLIALRMKKEKGMYLTFHKYSFPYFVVTAFIGYLMIKFL